jgi:hypothetical protein
MTIDWLFAKLKRKHHVCFECARYLSNESRNMVDSSKVYSECGGWCVQYYGKNYFIAISPYDNFCKNFKYKNKVNH